MKNRVTVIDVAQKAGVSQTTVSRVLNNHPQIREETRKKVLLAIKELEFSPNQVARSMVVKRTKTIGLSVGDISNPFYAEAAKVIIAKAGELGYDVIITDTNYRYNDFEKTLKTLVEKCVDGIIIANIHPKNSLVNELDIPVVYFNRKAEKEDNHYISVDNKKGVFLAVQHLVQLGHKDIAFLTYPPLFPSFLERFHGYKSALETFALRSDPTLIYDRGLSHEQINQFVSDSLSRYDRPTGFITTTDQQAMLVMDAVSRLGFRIPQDISVIGFGDIEISSHPYIGLTSVSIQKKEMASSALKALISLIEMEKEERSPIQVIMEPELVIRNTTNVIQNMQRS
ncbi:LacI family DNA-binding transcriptional regulator [Cytobacillus dafuensis]|uniref:LacI family DNA-binding transcriptional regulator n=1 Tax=Cytobacillus dafuensis TaxID=1742359 RepID=UPI00070FE53E|nr:LacI family DNA-binding transcriptional regulator [Cytobacillus dafuensis]